jgi:phosphatidylinositol alpha-1,6-mannosyltransferase
MKTRHRSLLVVTTDFPPSVGGIQIWTQQIALHLDEHHEITVIAPSQAGSAAVDARLPFTVIRFPDSRIRVLSLGAMALAVLQTLVMRRPSAVLFVHIFAAIAAGPLCLLLRVPYVVVTHCQEVQAPAIQRFLVPTLKHSRCCIAVSYYTASLLRAKGVPARKVTVIPTGVEEELFSTIPVDTSVVTRYVKANAKVVLTLARLTERYKGHDVLLRALPLIRAKVPDVQYIIAGDGAYRQFYEDLALSLNVQDAVTFTGRVSREARIALLDRCDVFAMISRLEPNGGEGFGIVFLEAAARRKPSIGGNSGGIPDAIVDGVTGLLVDPTNVPAIADAVIQILSDAELVITLGNAGHVRVRDIYTWREVAADLEGVLEVVLARS